MKATIRAHPLERLVLEMLKMVDHLTAHVLAEALGGKGAHHRKLASEVLTSMEEAGLVWRNDEGQYRLHDPYAQLTKVKACGFRYPDTEKLPIAWHSDPVPTEEVIVLLKRHLAESTGPGDSFVIAVVPLEANGVVHAKNLVTGDPSPAFRK